MTNEEEKKLAGVLVELAGVVNHLDSHLEIVDKMLKQLVELVERTHDAK